MPAYTLWPDDLWSELGSCYNPLEWKGLIWVFPLCKRYFYNLRLITPLCYSISLELGTDLSVLFPGKTIRALAGLIDIS